MKAGLGLLRSVRVGLWVSIAWACMAGGVGVASSQTASVRFACVSLRFHRGSEPFGLFGLELSSLPGQVNGELFPMFQADPYTHAALLTFIDEAWFLEVPGNMLLQVPMADSDGNGIPDFFQVENGVQATTAGVFALQGYGSGTVVAQWSRAPGSPTGTCRLDLKPNPFQSLAVFTHTFELWEYRGTLEYRRNDSRIEVGLQVARVGGEGSLWRGSATLIPAPEDPLNQLVLLPGAWTNELDQLMVWSTNYLFRDERWPTNYSALFDFQDGNPVTPEPDYLTWVWSVDDPNDSDGDGIPDLSDAVAAPPVQIRLWVRRLPGELEVGVEGPLQRTCRLLQTTNLMTGPWVEVASVTLTNASQVLLRQPLQGPARFWRALLP